MQYIGETIHRERKRQKLTLKKLGNRSGLATSSLCDIEKGRFVPSIESLYKIANALDVPVAFFLTSNYENNVNKITS